MSRCFQESHEAYARGDGATAKSLSNQGKIHQQNMEHLNQQASQQVFKENNQDRPPGEIDLHGLYVKEAIAYTDQALQDTKQQGLTELRVIVGKGLHSAGGSSKLKPAIEDLMRKHNLRAELDASNAGVLIVQIGRTGGLPPDELVRRLDRKDGECIVM
jgi:DNA-nicking Smr family endonuclease